MRGVQGGLEGSRAWVALYIYEHFNSAALKEAAVSVEKYGFPVPAAHITILPFSICLIALRLIYVSHIDCIGKADITLVSNFSFSSAFCIAKLFMTVASIPI